MLSLPVPCATALSANTWLPRSTKYSDVIKTPLFHKLVRKLDTHNSKNLNILHIIRLLLPKISIHFKNVCQPGILCLHILQHIWNYPITDLLTSDGAIWNLLFNENICKTFFSLWSLIFHWRLLAREWPSLIQGVITPCLNFVVVCFRSIVCVSPCMKDSRHVCPITT